MQSLADIRARLRDNLAQVEARITAACARVNRRREDVLLVAITKYVAPEIATLLLDIGVHDLGESRPQELWRKAALLPTDVRWHLVGHLQRNKIEQTLPLTRLIHSVDSVRLLAALSEAARMMTRPIDVLLEVNVSRESNKHGFSPDQVPLLVPTDEWPYPNVVPHGLMTMAAATTDPESVRPTFKELRTIRDQIQLSAASGEMIGSLVRELSMGMTNDFEIAIEEGATMVRIGSALFEGIID